MAAVAEAVETLVVSTTGQVTFSSETLERLGIQPGGSAELQLLSNGTATLRAAKHKRTIEDFYGILAGRVEKPVTLDEMEETIQKGWAGLR